MLCAIWYRLRIKKYVKNTHGQELLLVKSDTPSWVFSCFLHCTNSSKSFKASHICITLIPYLEFHTWNRQVRYFNIILRTNHILSWNFMGRKKILLNANYLKLRTNKVRTLDSFSINTRKWKIWPLKVHLQLRSMSIILHNFSPLVAP